MASRRETEYKKAQLKSYIREECLRNQAKPNKLLPPVRELADTFGLSAMLVWQILKEFEAEGLIYTIPRVGTFIGPPTQPPSEFYVMLVRSLERSRWHTWQTREGFEERIAALGGATLVLTHEMFAHCTHKRQLPPIAGIFYFDEENPVWPQEAKMRRVPKVQFRSSNAFLRMCDHVSFDDRDGGRRATQHLLQLGHRCIAFLGLHKNDLDLVFDWSVQREAGWKEAILQVGLSPQGLAYHPPESLSYQTIYSMEALAYAAAQPLALREDVTAVVCANDSAALGLLRALQSANIPHNRWPAIVGFDDQPEVAIHNISSFRLPWHEIGRTAADILWERRHNLLTGSFQHRYVTMVLIQRLTSPVQWSHSAERAALTLLDTATGPAD
ncbi:MAG TPA: GntR family transcriptional regulator [Chthonomonas sp.]|uniref:GntR family transcriptional regulator n=1 Tax=Chthonomonas sp. TaxID=2282153 RepID=UPI002B4B8A20|nr:GntR family transcriptional regulator [Chthonomonas sp.]HLI47714.1 GntR family transcriptional regulator [Chthonomonas sp.]